MNREWNMTFKLTVIAALTIVPFGWANAQCPDITGQWAATVHQVSQGSTVAGVANIQITEDTVEYWYTHSHFGLGFNDYAHGSYTVDRWCNVTWTMMLAVNGTEAVVTGVIVNSDEMLLTFSWPNGGASANLVARRMTNP